MDESGALSSGKGIPNLPEEASMAVKLEAYFVRRPGNWGPMYRAKVAGWLTLTDPRGRTKRIWVAIGNRVPQSMIDQAVDFSRRG
jgi:hypothetical protein